MRKAFDLFKRVSLELTNTRIFKWAAGLTIAEVILGVMPRGIGPLSMAVFILVVTVFMCATSFRRNGVKEMAAAIYAFVCVNIGAAIGTAVLALFSIHAVAATLPARPRAPRVSTAPTVRDVVISPDEVVDVSTRLRFSTTLELPKGEEVADVVSGDADGTRDGRWIINGSKGTGYVYVKPTAAGGETNLTVVSKSGQSYLFLLHETRKIPPDLRVSLKLPVAPEVAPKVPMVPASDLKTAQQQVEDYRATLTQERADYEKDRDSWKAKAAEAVAKAKAEAPGGLSFDYKYHEKRQFHVEAIGHDSDHTYIWADPSQAVALYGRFEGKPDLVHFSYSNGLYTADKVLEDGYLQIGKEKLKFRMWN